MSKKRSFTGLLRILTRSSVDLTMILFTGGLWFIWMLIRPILKKKYFYLTLTKKRTKEI